MSLSNFKNIRKTISNSTICKLNFDLISLKNYILSQGKNHRTLKYANLAEIACEDIKTIEAIWVGYDFKNFDFELYSHNLFGFGFIYPFRDKMSKFKFSGFIPFSYKLIGNKTLKLKISLGELKFFYYYKDYLNYFDSLIHELKNNGYNQKVEDLLKKFYITQDTTTIQNLKDKILTNFDYNKIDFVLDDIAFENTIDTIRDTINFLRKEKFSLYQHNPIFDFIMKEKIGFLEGSVLEIFQIQKEVRNNIKKYYPLTEDCSFLSIIEERINSCFKHFK